ncbi:DUF2523 family protein [Herbaspirillum frisingense]|uniref:DUF2523 family protein n=1 Tax=Herbaspirillum frisingense TaxID=92645 RepID=UPI0039AFD2D2
MYGILLSALYQVLSFIFSQIIVKFCVMFALYFIISDLMEFLGAFIPSPSSLTGALAGLDSATWYFLDLMCFSAGAPLVITALSYRFLIRRMPVIG